MDTQGIPAAQATPPQDAELEDDLDQILENFKEERRVADDAESDFKRSRQSDLHVYWRQTKPRRVSRAVADRLLEHAMTSGGGTWCMPTATRRPEL
eukprot:15407947-Alexandrium_andersonii.AAC.1